MGTVKEEKMVVARLVFTFDTRTHRSLVTNGIFFCDVLASNEFETQRYKGPSSVGSLTESATATSIFRHVFTY